MRESYIEGLAIHDGPESCVGDRKVTGEALTGERTGAVLSREIGTTRVLTPLSEAESNTADTVIARYRRALRGRRPAARAETLCARTGRSLVFPWMDIDGTCRKAEEA